MEEAAKVIGGVAGELVFFVRSFLLGFLLRLGYEPLILVRKLFHHPRLLVDLQDILFWTAGSFLMFGLLFRENNGTPRFFSIIGILFGMALYQAGPGKLTGCLFDQIRRKKQKRQRKNREKRLKKTKKDSMIKEQDEHSQNKRGEDGDRENGSPQESKSQVDRIGARDSSSSKRNDMDSWKQPSRAERAKSGTAKNPRRENRRGKGPKRRTRSVQ